MLQVSKNLKRVTIGIVSKYLLSSYFIFGTLYSSSKIAWTSESITTKSKEGVTSDGAEQSQHSADAVLGK